MSIIDVEKKRVVQTLALPEDARKENDVLYFWPRASALDGKSLLVIGQTESRRWGWDTVSVWDVKTGQRKSSWSLIEKAKLEKPEEWSSGFAGDVMLTALSADGTKAAFAVTKDKLVKSNFKMKLTHFLWVAVFETTTGKLLHAADMDEFIDYDSNAIAFSPNGKFLAVDQQLECRFVTGDGEALEQLGIAHTGVRANHVPDLIK